MTVLIADDERHITLVLKRAFERAGFVVVTSQDGEEAFEFACLNTPDLIVTDFQMPGWGGIDLARALHAFAPTSRTPMVMLTARGHMVCESIRAETNIVALLAKPFSAKDVVKTAIEILSRPEHDTGAVA